MVQRSLGYIYLRDGILTIEQVWVHVTTFGIRRALVRKDWTPKTNHHIAKGQNTKSARLNISDFPSHYIFTVRY